MSVVNTGPGKTSLYGNVVSPGALAQNHQHVFCVHIDPAIDGYKNTVIAEESHCTAIDKKTNPQGKYYEVQQRVVAWSECFDAERMPNRLVKVVNKHKAYPISGKADEYKFTPAATQLLLAQPDSVQPKRALFAQHHVWVTKHLACELYASGRYTLQSQNEIGGVADAVKRDEVVEGEDVVVWNVFGLSIQP